MTATGHALIGTVIAAKVPDPLVAIPLALASHLAADVLPHWDSGTHGREKNGNRLLTEAVVDVLLGFALSYLTIAVFFPETNLAYVFVIILVAQGFDWITAPYYIFHIKKPPFTWFYRLQKIFHNTLDKPWGIITQIATVVILIFLAKMF